MNIYIAAPYKRMYEARETREALAAHDIICTSRWLNMDPDHDLGTDPAVLRREAVHDEEDIVDADAMIVLNLEPSEGKAVELGIALGMRAQGLSYPIIVVGVPSNVFHFHPSVTVVPTLEDAIARLTQ